MRPSYRSLTDLLPPRRIVICQMARTYDEKLRAAVAYHGEIWTDGRGLAVVVLPRGTLVRHRSITRSNQPSPLVAATVTAELEDGQFAIKTNEPHVKVAWRLIAYPASGQPRHRRTRTWNVDGKVDRADPLSWRRACTAAVFVGIGGGHLPGRDDRPTRVRRHG